MRYRKGIKLSEATEDEILRCQMENILRTSHNEPENLGECSEALAKIYILLKYRYAGFFFGFMIGIYLVVGFFALIVKFFWRKR